MAAAHRAVSAAAVTRVKTFCEIVAAAVDADTGTTSGSGPAGSCSSSSGGGGGGGDGGGSTSTSSTTSSGGGGDGSTSGSSATSRAGRVPHNGRFYLRVQKRPRPSPPSASRASRSRPESIRNSTTCPRSRSDSGHVYGGFRRTGRSPRRFGPVFISFSRSEATRGDLGQFLCHVCNEDRSQSEAMWAIRFPTVNQRTGRKKRTRPRPLLRSQKTARNGRDAPRARRWRPPELARPPRPWPETPR